MQQTLVESCGPFPIQSPVVSSAALRSGTYVYNATPRAGYVVGTRRGARSCLCACMCVCALRTRRYSCAVRRPLTCAAHAMGCESSEVVTPAVGVSSGWRRPVYV
eukprot:5440773-Prymnesium_polylepis.1